LSIDSMARGDFPRRGFDGHGAYDCQRLAERAPNQRVRDILLDTSRTWTRLALEAEEWRRDNSPRSRLAKKDATTTDRPKIISPNPLPLPAAPPEPPDS
jgi:hypothetical protein